MLRKLQIQHYAIIDAIEIDFSGQLNIITGETGAGKSILMGALSLILGDRADSSVLMYPDKKCVIEGYFSAGQKTAVLDFLKANDFDVEEVNGIPFSFLPASLNFTIGIVVKKKSKTF